MDISLYVTRTAGDAVALSRMEAKASLFCEAQGAFIKVR